MRKALVLVFLGAALAVWLALVQLPPRAATPPRVTPPPAPQPSAAPKTPVPASAPVRVKLEFRADETAAKVATEVGRAIRPRECALAMGSRGESRLACLFVDAEEHLYQLDADLSADDFPALRKLNFKEAEDPWARTISTYRSLAKTAMGYRATGGDRLIVLLCPKSEWTQVNLECEHFAPKIFPIEGSAPRF